MAQNSGIEWTDHTFNPWEGCTKVSPGCANCYAETLVSTRFKRVEWGPGKARRRTSPANWQKPIQWNHQATRGNFRECDVCGKREFRKWDNTLPPGGLSCCSNPDCVSLPESESFVARPRVFCASLADWIDDEVPIGWLADLLRLIYETQNLDWQLLTKRPQNWESRCFKVWEECHGFEQETRLGDWLFEWLTQNSPPANVWIGTTAEDQTRANERIPALLNIPAKVRFLSCEPLLGPVRFPSGDCPCGKPLCYDPARDGSPRGIHWVIAGGESGANARPMNPEWARSLRDQCAAAKVPFLFKQWGEWLPDTQNPKVDHPKSSDRQGIKVGKKAAGRLLDGIEHNGFPGVRE